MESSLISYVDPDTYIPFLFAPMVEKLTDVSTSHGELGEKKGTLPSPG